MNSRLPLFSIVTVCLNPGQELPKTVASVLSQDFPDFEYVIKDGVSQDGTEHNSYADPRVTFISQADTGIYDAMNQALALCSGRYVNFLNAGDSFANPHVLGEVARVLDENQYPDVAYVDRYNEKFEAVTHYPSALSPWFLFRKPICHQALFVSHRTLSKMGGFDTTFRIFADYDLLLKSLLVEKAYHVHCPLVGVNYQDGGVSSAPKNRRLKQEELRRLRGTYFNRRQRFFYGIVSSSTLPGLRVRLMHQQRVPWLSRVILSLTQLVEKIRQ
jgi:glycosyltransferase involved in cell wall biosynthesis